MADSLIDDLKCPICLELCDTPVETNCCHKLLCQSCMEKLENKCVYCRKACVYSNSVLAQRLIDSLPHECEFCKTQMTLGNKKEHSLRCQKKTVNCSICKVKIEKLNIFKHLIENHNQHLQDNVDLILESLDNKKSSITIEPLKNRNGSLAKLGETGKYYCGSRLDGPRCNCCDGMCGIHTGCNCSSCMELDIKTRNLPKGWLVNPDGFNAKKANNNIFYCGRRVLVGVHGCDGHCGPNNGPNCDGCKRLDTLASTRYHKLFN